jgi:hypothetical protein
MGEPKMPTPEEIAKIEKNRTISDAELLKEGAEWEIDDSGEKKALNITKKQEKKICEEMSRTNRDQKHYEKIKKMIENDGIRKGDSIRINGRIAEYLGIKGNHVSYEENVADVIKGRGTYDITRKININQIEKIKKVRY